MKHQWYVGLIGAPWLMAIMASRMSQSGGNSLNTGKYRGSRSTLMMLGGENKREKVLREQR
jgi:hypothetical protein